MREEQSERLGMTSWVVGVCHVVDSAPSQSDLHVTYRDAFGLETMCLNRYGIVETIISAFDLRFPCL